MKRSNKTLRSYNDFASLKRLLTQCKNSVHAYLLLAITGLYCPSLCGTPIEEVLVTTQYRQQNSQTLPLSASITSATDIDLYDVHGNAGLAQLTPGLSHAEFAAGQSYLAIRGILSIDDGPGMDNSVVVFVDGVYIGRLSNVDFDMLDIQRIEVLRGPQGTLFGRNAIGGAINVITNKPDEEFDAYLSAGIGNYNSARLGGMLNGRVNTAISSRFSFSHRQHSGYSHNILINEENQTEDKTNLRWQLASKMDNQEWRLALDYAEDTRADMGRFPVTESNLGSLKTWLSLGGKESKTTSPLTGFSKRDSYGLSVNGSMHFNKGTLENIFSARRNQSDWAMASTAAPIAVNPPFPPMDLDNGRYGSDISDVIDETVNQLSAESRWISDLNDDIHLTAGIFALAEISERAEQYQLVENTVANGEVLVGNEITEQKNTTHSFAIYTQAQWDLSQRWRVIGGLRWTLDKKDTRSLSLNCGIEHELVDQSPYCSVKSGSYLNIMSSVFNVGAQKSWTDLSPKVTFQYLSEFDWMAYSTLSRGYKSGGFPGSPGSAQVAQTAVEPESAWNYELGVKSDLLDKQLRFNAALFYTDYRNLQIVRFGPSPDNPGFGSFTTTNIGRADISGIEIETAWHPTERLRFSLKYAYLHSIIHDLIIETVAGTVDASGSELRQAPENSYHIAANYALLKHQHYGHINIHYDYAYVDAQLSDYINRDTVIDKISQSNLVVNWASPQQLYALDFWVRNLEGSRGIAHSYTIAGGVYGIWSPPKTFGITLTRHFTEF